jgi:membrane protein DedA with SNARE-associated domain
MFLSSDLVAFFATVIGTFLEGETVILTTTIFSSLGHYGLLTIFAASVVGTFVGDELMYWLGRFLGNTTEPKIFGKNIVSEKAILRARRFFSNHGGKTVFLLRFTYGTRTTGYFLAGALRMPFWRFFVADTFAIICWVMVLMLLGKFIGQPAINFISGWGGIIIGLSISIVLAITVVVLQKKFSKP